jgi:hypothetical protein
MKDNGAIHAEKETKIISKNAKWAGSDLNQRPPPCQGKLLSNENIVHLVAANKRDSSTSSENQSSGTSMINDSYFWSGFQSYLNKYNNHVGTRDRLNYAVKYAHILDTGEAHQLLELSPEKRMHIMKSLSALAKYTGRYDGWQQVRQRFQLKWVKWRFAPSI